MQSKLNCYQMFYVNLMVMTKEKARVDPPNIKGRESKNITWKIMSLQNKAAREEEKNQGLMEQLQN